MSFLLQNWVILSFHINFPSSIGFGWFTGQLDLNGNTPEASLSQAISKKKHHEFQWESKGYQPPMSPFRPKTKKRALGRYYKGLLGDK